MAPHWSNDPRLGSRSALRVGGAGHRVLRVDNETDLEAAWLGLDDSDRLRMVALGHMTNVVISDCGISEPVITFAPKPIAVEGESLTASAGVTWDNLVETAVSLGLSGIEMMSGIPGTVGAAPVQNIAAYGQQISDVVERIRAFDTSCGRWVDLEAADCMFAYRDSIFRSIPGRFLISQIRLRLRRSQELDAVTYPEVARRLADRAGGPNASLSERREAVLHVRSRKGLLSGAGYPCTAGSFFKSPYVDRDAAFKIISNHPSYSEGGFAEFLEQYGNSPDAPIVKIPAAQVLLAAGFKNGDAWGPVGLLESQIVAIENRGNACAQDVRSLAALVVDRVEQRTGVQLDIEPVFLGPFRSPDSKSLVAVAAKYEAGSGCTPDWVQSSSDSTTQAT